MVDKAYSQQELIMKMPDTPPIHSAHQMRRAFYFNEWIIDKDLSMIDYGLLI